MHDVVQDQWLRLLANAGDPRRIGRSMFVVPCATMLRTAYAHPRLQVLFPWMGMGELHFSWCTEQPWTWDIPYIAPTSDGRFLVAGPLRSQIVGHADSAHDAVAMVVDRLPPECGKAFVGTPAELVVHERKDERG
ncbi:DUF6193 family natural product biosynthesis protein [Yinghuangia sp. ASG 101]|uniref:DUF6193 family natural product biosynthesis protein n=1 Tax=Yinghuangia sp. ASG 101 TaxID=2896848 RepID=UPI001E3B61B3|nr:DUF6193 family natural product biosynthesis protein [Yinghuangia sp. ASG 101]UGQ14737.1 DUF6193 family natural product biosynthesis protein [Yinghuangia sp. ASG 101]